MSTYTTDRASPFTRAVVSSMRKLWVFGPSVATSPINPDQARTYRYPEALADQSFDNTGCQLMAYIRLQEAETDVMQYYWKLLLIQFADR